MGMMQCFCLVLWGCSVGSLLKRGCWNSTQSEELLQDAIQCTQGWGGTSEWGFSLLECSQIISLPCLCRNCNMLSWNAMLLRILILSGGGGMVRKLFHIFQTDVSRRYEDQGCHFCSCLLWDCSHATQVTCQPDLLDGSVCFTQGKLGCSSSSSPPQWSPTSGEWATDQNVTVNQNGLSRHMKVAAAGYFASHTSECLRAQGEFFALLIFVESSSSPLSLALISLSFKNQVIKFARGSIKFYLQNVHFWILPLCFQLTVLMNRMLKWWWKWTNKEGQITSFLLWTFEVWDLCLLLAQVSPYNNAGKWLKSRHCFVLLCTLLYT